MLLAVNANSPFKEPWKGCTKSVRVFGNGKSRVGWAIKLHVEIDQSYVLSNNLEKHGKHQFYGYVPQFHDKFKLKRWDYSLLIIQNLL